MLEELKRRVYKANIDLVKHGLVIFTWGNASGIDRNKGLMVIKPSGIEYDVMKPEDMVVTDMDGNVVEGDLKPSSDTQIHLELYRNFESIGGVVHTHSTYATGWAQSGKALPNIGTTHSDFFNDDIPITRDMTNEEIEQNYELNTGKVIVEAFKDIDPMDMKGVLVKNHGPFTWGKNPNEAVENSVVLETVAQMALVSYSVNPNPTMNEQLKFKHYYRKHGKDAYYGQK
jgi:L-ribulose-5-phosphate 4-epimerase